MDQHRRLLRRPLRWVAAIGAGAIAATSLAVLAGPAGAATPKPGGEVRFGIEAETTNYCLPSAQLAISGIQVVAAVYDTLTAPNTKGKYVPNLAESVTPNADFTEWTIKVRSGIKFHDGTPLNADAVKANMEAWQKGALLGIVFANMGTVTKVDDLTVKATMKSPWKAFPAYLYLVGRAGIAAPAQLASPNCATTLIGTGPFKFESQKLNESLVVVKNPTYWKKGAKGEQLPYLDKITFVPVVDSPTRDTQLLGGQLNIMHTSSAQSIDKLRNSAGIDTVTEPPGNRDTRYYLLNSSKAPFNTLEGRKAVAQALNVKQINTIRNKGVNQVTTSIIDTKAQGYVKNNGFPKYDPKAAKALADQVKAANGGTFSLTLLTTDDTENLAEAQLVAEQLGKVGITANITQVAQSQLISTVLIGNYSMALFRNFHSDPEFGDAGLYPWFSSVTSGTSPNFLNFPRISNAEVQATLDNGRKTGADADYVAFNKLMGSNVYVVPAWYVNWTMASKGVKGVLGAPLPDGSQPRYMYGRIPVDGLYKTK